MPLEYHRRLILQLLIVAYPHHMVRLPHTINRRRMTPTLHVREIVVLDINPQQLVVLFDDLLTTELGSHSTFINVLT